MFLISGWYDHYPDGVLRAFGDLRARSVPAVRSLHRLLMGPWEHSFIGQADQGALSYPEAVGVPDSMLQLFFARFLKGEPNNWENDPAITYFQMGENIWRTTPSWTSLGAYPDTFYFAANQTLQHEPPTANSQPDTFTCDPRNPVPAAGGSRFSPFDNSILTGPQDLAPGIEVREDVLVFSTPVLTQEIVIDGPVVISLAVSCNRLDTDISARLCDVFPDGRSMLMQQGIRRMRFRDSYAAEELMIPGTVYNVEIILPDLALTITKGHRLRIDIAGADYPFFDLNLNNGQAMYTAGDTLTAHTVLYHDSLHPSMVIMPGPEHRSAVRFPRQALSVSHAQNSQVQIYTRNRMIYVSSQKQYSRIVIMNTQGQKVADLNTAGLSGASKASAIRVSPGAFFCTVVSPGEVLTWRVVVH
jgi:putative CocE/NonD family hydrolase